MGRSIRSSDLFVCLFAPPMLPFHLLMSFCLCVCLSMLKKKKQKRMEKEKKEKKRRYSLSVHTMCVRAVSKMDGSSGEREKDQSTFPPRREADDSTPCPWIKGGGKGHRRVSGGAGGRRKAGD
mmetsp:Transcript_52764/g.103172  ORF Transcript_52764/g.103172 Transcript_52764/m.103172 type:complete len:123 (+) Transcript_52764:778-1146(+)